MEDALEAQRMLQVERERADMLTERIEGETAHGTKAALAQQLAQSLGDNEELRQEVARLRSELRRVAPKPEADKPDAPAEDLKPRRLGDCLVEAGAITRDQLSEALEEQRNSPQRRLEYVLIEKGFVGEQLIADTLAELGGVKVVHLNGKGVEDEAARLVSGRLAGLHNCIPLRATDDTLTLAMANPLDLIAIEDVERATRRRVEPVVALASEIRSAIQRVYAA